MLQSLKELDREVFIYLNGLGNPTFDPFWIIATKQLNWIPLFLLLLVLIFQKKGAKNTLLILLFVALLIICCNEFTDLIRNSVKRIRPCNNLQLRSSIRMLHHTPTFSFFSGHASNSMAASIFIYSILRKYFKYAYFLFLWPMIFAYSRIYVGVHYPIDILTGYVVGATFGFVFYKLYAIAEQKYFPQ